MTVDHGEVESALRAMIQYWTMLEKGTVDLREIRETASLLDPRLGKMMESLYDRLVNEGMEKGRVEERAAILARQLERRFGSLSAEIKARIATADPQRLELWLDRVLAEDSIEGIFRD